MPFAVRSRVLPVLATAHMLTVAAEPNAVVELRSGGEVMAEYTTNRAGRVTITQVPRGTYVLRQVVDGEPGLLTAPLTVG